LSLVSHKTDASLPIRTVSRGWTPCEQAPLEDIRDVSHLWVHDDNLDIQWTCAYREPIRKSETLREKLFQLLSVKDLQYDRIYRDIVIAMKHFLDRCSSMSNGNRTIIREFCSTLERTSDPIHIIKCYSSTTSFYKYVNQYLAKDGIEFFEPNAVDIHADYQTVKCFLQLVAIMMHHDRFYQYRFCGTTYRGMLLTQGDLDKYVVGSKILTKSFLSTSKDRELASIFGGLGQEHVLKTTSENKPIQLATLCLYVIRNRITALNIESISELEAGEKEVLILPFAPFQVKHVRRLPNDTVEIILEELINDGTDMDLLFMNVNT
jgi:hypothetical protein